jgi:creatinine amidohydrolase
MKLVELPAQKVTTAAKRAVAVLPLAAIEQHGPHLAVSTDSAIVTAVAEAVEAKLPKAVVLCPTLHFGSSHHHLKFGGTLSLPPEIYTNVVIELAESLLGGGFRRIVLLNGHGGNVTPVKQALSILSHRHDDALQPNIALATYWEVGGKAFAGQPPMKTPALSHACEYETSLMLHLYPGRVNMSAARRGKRPKNNGYIPWEDDEPQRGVTLAKRTHFISDTGASGDPRLATAAKGAVLFRAAVSAVAKFIGEFKDWPLMRNYR